MNKIRTQQRTLLIVFFLLFVLLLLNSVSSSARAAFFQVFSPVQSFVWSIPSLARFHSQDQIQSLKAENVRLQTERAETEDMRLENKTLRRALELREREGFRLAGGEIAGKMIGEERIFLKVQDGSLMKERMPVVTAQGLAAGTVERILGDTLEVRLLSHPESSIDAKIPGVPGAALLRGKGGGKMVLDLIPHQMTVGEGDTVATSTIGGIFPENLLIGTVRKVEKKDTESFQEAEIQPLFTLSEHEVLFVVTNFPL